MQRDKIVMQQALRLFETKKNLGLLIIWPISFATGVADYIQSSLKSLSNPLFEVDLVLQGEGPANLLEDLHWGKKWWHEHLNEELLERFPHGCQDLPLRVIGFEVESPSQLRPWKLRLRDELGMGKAPFHVSNADCTKHIGSVCECPISADELQQETLRAARLLLHPNSLHRLEHAPRQLPEKFETLFPEYLSLFKDPAHDPKRFCLTNGSALAIYGLRDVGDIDFLYDGPMFEAEPKRIDCNNRTAEQIFAHPKFPHTREELIYEPNHFLYFRGVKIQCPQTVLEMKRVKLIRGKRREKDEMDVQRLERLLSSDFDISSSQTMKAEEANYPVYPATLNPAKDKRSSRLQRSLKKRIDLPPMPRMPWQKKERRLLANGLLKLRAKLHILRSPKSQRLKNLAANTSPTRHAFMFAPTQLK